MAIKNPFDLLGDDDKDDPSELVEIHKKAAEKKALEAANAKLAAREARVKARAEEAKEIAEKERKEAERKASFEKRQADRKRSVDVPAVAADATAVAPPPSLQSNGDAGHRQRNRGNVNGFSGGYKGDRVNNSANGRVGGLVDGQRNQYRGNGNGIVRGGSARPFNGQFDLKNQYENGNVAGSQNGRPRNQYRGNNNGIVRGGSLRPSNGQFDLKSENGSIAGSQNGSEKSSMIDEDGFEVPKRRHQIRVVRRNEQPSEQPINADAVDTMVKETPVEVSIQEPTITVKTEDTASIPEKETERDESADSEAKKVKAEEEKKLMTLSEYEKIREEKRKAIPTLKTPEERKVHINSELESMQRLSLKKRDDEIFIKLGSEKETRKVVPAKDGGKGEVAKLGDGKSKKITSIHEALYRKSYYSRPPRPYNREGYQGSTGSIVASSNGNQGRSKTDFPLKTGPPTETDQSMGRGGDVPPSKALQGGIGGRRSPSPATAPASKNQAKISSVKPLNFEDQKSFPPLKPTS